MPATLTPPPPDPCAAARSPHPHPSGTAWAWHEASVLSLHHLRVRNPRCVVFVVLAKCHSHGAGATPPPPPPPCPPWTLPSASCCLSTLTAGMTVMHVQPANTSPPPRDAPPLDGRLPGTHLVSRSSRALVVLATGTGAAFLGCTAVGLARKRGSKRAGAQARGEGSAGVWGGQAAMHAVASRAAAVGSVSACRLKRGGIAGVWAQPKHCDYSVRIPFAELFCHPCRRRYAPLPHQVLLQPPMAEGGGRSAELQPPVPTPTPSPPCPSVQALQCTGA